MMIYCIDLLGFDRVEPMGVTNETLHVLTISWMSWQWIS